MNPTRKQNNFSPARHGKPATPVSGSPETPARQSEGRKLFEAVAQPFNSVAEPVRKLRWQRRTWGIAALLAAVLAHGFVAAAQETNAPTQTNAPAPASMTARPDYSVFKLITTRNIFDPNRYPQSAGTTRRATDYFEFVGTMSYTEGTLAGAYAVFNGSGSEFKKMAKLADTIGDYKIMNIALDSVSLASGTNEFKLAMNAQMRRGLDGEWFLADSSASSGGGSRSSIAGSRRAGRSARNNETGATTAVNETTISTTSTTPTASDAGSAPASGGNESDIVRRMMQRREQEK